jgi:hypothetical protein
MPTETLEAAREWLEKQRGAQSRLSRQSLSKSRSNRLTGRRLQYVGRLRKTLPDERESGRRIR